MTADGFLTNKRRSPMSMGAAFAIQGIILLGLLSMAPKIAERVIPSEPIVIFTPIEPEAPPPIETQVDTPKQPPISHVTTTERVVDTPTPTASPVGPTDFTPLPSGPVVGSGTAPFVEPTPMATPKPVLVDASIDPRYASALQPDYPGAEQRAEIEGKATVRVLIGTDGRVKAVELVSADRPGFFKATEEQARKRWRFKPAMRDGVAVESWKQMTVHFRLQS